MAPSESGKRDNNVTSLEEVRTKRAKRSSKDSASTKNKDPGTLSDIQASPAVGHDTEPDSAMTEQVEISLAGKATRISKRRFDKCKVERIKAELAAGSYQIDFFQVADKFIEHERYS